MASLLLILSSAALILSADDPNDWPRFTDPVPTAEEMNFARAAVTLCVDAVDSGSLADAAARAGAEIQSFRGDYEESVRRSDTQAVLPGFETVSIWLVEHPRHGTECVVGSDHRIRPVFAVRALHRDEFRNPELLAPFLSWSTGYALYGNRESAIASMHRNPPPSEPR